MATAEHNVDWSVLRRPALVSYPGCRLDLRKEAQASPGDHRNKPESLRHCVGVSKASLKKGGGGSSEMQDPRTHEWE